MDRQLSPDEQARLYLFICLEDWGLEPEMDFLDDTLYFRAKYDGEIRQAKVIVELQPPTEGRL